MEKISFVIPCYHSEHTVGGVVDDAPAPERTVGGGVDGHVKPLRRPFPEGRGGSLDKQEVQPDLEAKRVLELEMIVRLRGELAGQRVVPLRVGVGR